MQSASEGEDIRLPSRDFLDCHWRVAEILNASSMGEAIDLAFNKWEDLKEGEGNGSLREDGMSDVSEFLKAAFWGRVAGYLIR